MAPARHGLAAARFADDADDLPGCDLEAEIAATDGVPPRGDVDARGPRLEQAGVH